MSKTIYSFLLSFSLILSSLQAKQETEASFAIPLTAQPPIKFKLNNFHDSSPIIEENTTSHLPDPTFQGWWQTVTRGDLSGFGYGTNTSDIDSYIYIDISQYDPVNNPIITIQTLCGTPTKPRECTYCDTPNGIIYNQYYVPSSTELVSTFDVNGPDFNPAFGQSFYSLKLQKNKKTICASAGSQPFFSSALFPYSLSAAGSILLRKVDSPPPVRPYNDTTTDFASVNSPIEMAHYYFNALFLNYNIPQNPHLNDPDYRSYKKRKKIFEKMLGKGITVETPIRKMRVSTPAPHFIYPEIPLSDDILLTDIFTDGYSFVTCGSTVEIKGFEGKWAALNGVYVNGVPIYEEGAVPNPSPSHVDVASGKKPQKGSFRNVFNHFQLRFDSTNAENFPRDELGYATEVEGQPMVKVTHRFTSDIEYPAFCAALRALFFALYGVSYHNQHLAFTEPNSVFLYSSWQELQTAVSNDVAIRQFISTRANQAFPSSFYNNALLNLGSLPTTYNDPFNLKPIPGSPIDYNIDLANYVKYPKNLYWAIIGTPTGRTQFDPSTDPNTLGYKPLIPASQPASFTSILGDLEVVNGYPVPQNPDAIHYTILGNPSVDEVSNSNNYYVGLIDPSLTDNKKVGYLRWCDFFPTDPFNYFYDATFPPQVPKTIRFARETFSKIIAPMMHYLQTTLDCDALILDMRSNTGGILTAPFCLAEFFGDDRLAFESDGTYWTYKGDGHLNLPYKKNKEKKLINLNNKKKYEFYNDIQRLTFKAYHRFDVRQNEKYYGPGVVFKGSKKRPKKVVILIDHRASSATDVFPHFFLGPKLDGNLGSYTTTKIIGDIDGRFKGNSSFGNAFPVSLNNNLLYDSNGNPVSPFYFSADTGFFGELRNGKTSIFYNQQPNKIAPNFAPTLTGKAGNAPLPNDWESTVWPDLGLISPKKGHFSSKIKKTNPIFSNQATWRDCWLEQAILEAIQD